MSSSQARDDAHNAVSLKEFGQQAVQQLQSQPPVSSVFSRQYWPR